MADNASRSTGYEVVSSEVAYRSPFSTVRLDRVAMPDGKVGTREIVEHRAAVGAVVVDEDDSVVLVRQYRHAFGTPFLEVPAGLMDVEGEDPADAVQRELAEEVRLHAGTLVHLLTFNNSAGWTTEQTAVYLATDLSPVERPDGFVLEHEEADMTVERIPFDEAVAMVADGRITDAKTVVGLLAVANRR